MDKDEKIAIAVCDSGRVEGSHSAAINFSIMNNDISHHFTDFIRSKGIKIATQRQEIFNTWMLPDLDHVDWLLWLDSDIEIGYDVLKCLIDSADKDKFPTGPWCKEGDFVLTRPYAGTRIRIHDREFRIINDDTVEGVVSDPRGFSHA